MAFCRLTTNHRSVQQYVHVTRDGCLTVWEDGTPKSITIKPPVSPTIITAFDIEREIALIGLQTGHLVQVNINHGAQNILAPLHKSQITAVKVSQDSKFYACDVNGIISVYPQNGWEGKILKYDVGSITALKVHLDAIYVAVEYGTHVQAFDKKTGDFIQRWPQVSHPPIHSIQKSAKGDCLLIAYNSHVVMYSPGKGHIFLVHRIEPHVLQINEWRHARHVLHILSLNVQGQVELFRVHFKSERASSVQPEAEITVPGHKIIYAEFTSSSTVTLVYGDTPTVETVQYTSSQGDLIKGTIAIPAKRPPAPIPYSDQKSVECMRELSFVERLHPNRPGIPKNLPQQSNMEFVLLHALQNADDDLLKKVFSCTNEAVIFNSVKHLPQSLVAPFLAITSEMVRKNSGNISAAKWLKAIFLVHAQHLNTLPSFSADLLVLHTEIKTRMKDYADFFRLKGRMDLVMSQIEAKKNHQIQNFSQKNQKIQNQLIQKNQNQIQKNQSDDMEEGDNADEKDENTDRDQDTDGNGGTDVEENSEGDSDTDGDQDESASESVSESVSEIDDKDS